MLDILRPRRGLVRVFQFFDVVLLLLVRGDRFCVVRRRRRGRGFRGFQLTRLPSGRHASPIPKGGVKLS